MPNPFSRDGKQVYSSRKGKELKACGHVSNMRLKVNFSCESKVALGFVKDMLEDKILNKDWD